MKSIPLTETPNDGIHFQWPIDKRGSYFCIYKKGADEFFTCSFVVAPKHRYYNLDELPSKLPRKFMGKFPVLRDDNKRVEFTWNYVGGTDGWKQSGFYEMEWTALRILEHNMETINEFLKYARPKWQRKFLLALELYRLENPLYNKKVARAAGVNWDE